MPEAPAGEQLPLFDPASPGILGLSDAKLRNLTIRIARITAAIEALHIDAGMILDDDYWATPAEQLELAERILRWHSLQPARELVYTVVLGLMHTGRRFEAQWGHTEEQLCALEKDPTPSRERPATPSKA